MNRRTLLTGQSAFTTAWRQAAAAFHADLAAENVVGGDFRFLNRGRVLGQAPYGFADLATRRRVDANTVWHWASITKTFTSVAALQVRDLGLVGLDDPVLPHLPELRPVHDPYGALGKITLRHLLTHSAGFRSATFPWTGDQPWHPHEPKAWSQVVAMMPFTELEFEPGTRHSYSNLGLSLVGRLIEVLTGEHIGGYIDKNVLKPLGMDLSYFDLTPHFLLPRRSNNYYVVNGEPVANGLEVDTGATLANGGLNAPMDDFGRWADFLLGVRDPGTVLSRNTLAEMWTPQMPADDGKGADKAFIGLGFFIVDHARPGGGTTRFVGHAGYQLAFHTLFQVHPETGSAFLAAANTVTRGQKSVWATHLRDAVYDRLVPLFA